MTKKLFSIIALFCLIGSAVYGDNGLEDKIKNIEKQRQRRQKVVLDNALRGEINDFLLKNENVSAKDFKKLRLAGQASDVLLEDLDERYGATIDNYQIKIKSERERKNYRIASKFRTKWSFRAFFTCKSDDENAAMKSMKKVEAIRTRISEIFQKNRSLAHSDEIIKLQEQILDECRFEAATYSLLDSYRIRGMREKFNNLMVRMIEDDQVNYDYLYSGIDTINTSFILQYLFFLQDVNRPEYKYILSKDQVRTIAESVLIKHREIFNMKIRPYYSADKEVYGEIMIRDGVRSMVHLSSWLRGYGLEELNDKLIESFFHDEMVIRTLRENRIFNDFLDYLLQRPGFEKYHEG